jgi:hypothetical protein
VMVAVSKPGHKTLVTRMLALARDSRWPLRRFVLGVLPDIVSRQGGGGGGGGGGERRRGSYASNAAPGPSPSLSPPYTSPPDEALDQQIVALLRDGLTDHAAQVGRLVGGQNRWSVGKPFDG